LNQYSFEDILEMIVPSLKHAPFSGSSQFGRPGGTGSAVLRARRFDHLLPPFLKKREGRRETALGPAEISHNPLEVLKHDLCPLTAAMRESLVIARRHLLRHRIGGWGRGPRTRGSAETAEAVQPQVPPASDQLRCGGQQDSSQTSQKASSQHLKESAVNRGVHFFAPNSRSHFSPGLSALVISSKLRTASSVAATFTQIQFKHNNRFPPSQDTDAKHDQRPIPPRRNTPPLQLPRPANLLPSPPESEAARTARIPPLPPPTTLHLSPAQAMTPSTLTPTSTSTCCRKRRKISMLERVRGTGDGVLESRALIEVVESGERRGMTWRGEGRRARRKWQWRWRAESLKGE
jgi:hypothetical protein